jgi:hypothetical protein
MTLFSAENEPTPPGAGCDEMRNRNKDESTFAGKE